LNAETIPTKLMRKGFTMCKDHLLGFFSPMIINRYHKEEEKKGILKNIMPTINPENITTYKAPHQLNWKNPTRSLLP
jgi:hypothetical protein